MLEDRQQAVVAILHPLLETELCRRSPAGHLAAFGNSLDETVGKKQVEEIAKQKMPDLNCDSVESAMAQVVGSARSMGLQVVE